MSADTFSSILPPPSRSAVWRYIFAGLCASLVGIGLARFVYTPLLPSLIQAHWFSASDTVYLGAANLVGYFLGAVLGRPIANRLSNAHTLRLMMLLVTIAFFACAFPVSVGWFFGWRLVSGVAGGVIMVLVASTVLLHVPAARKHLASGAIFLGLGIGIAGSGAVVPMLMDLGLRETWIGLAILSAILTAASWFSWPAAARTGSALLVHQKHSAAARTTFGRTIYVLYVQYALMALGVVPAMVFFVDFVVRGLGAGAHVGALYWILYGLGAIIGPPLYGFLADRLSPQPTVRVVLLVQAMAVAFLYTASNLTLIALLAVVIGSFPSGAVPLVLARVHESIPNDPHRQNVAWSRATTVFATFQSLAGYAYSAIFNGSSGDHRLLFLIAGVALGIALIAQVSMPRQSVCETALR